MFMKTLKASLMASAIGTGASILGLTDILWPAHPQLAVFFLTLGATVVLFYCWPFPEKAEQNSARKPEGDSIS
jgi:hypothetical protein